MGEKLLILRPFFEKKYYQSLLSHQFLKNLSNFSDQVNTICVQDTSYFLQKK